MKPPIAAFVRKKTKIKIPVGGLPSRTFAGEPDTPFHRKRRLAVSIVTACSCVAAVTSSFLVDSPLPFFRAGMMASVFLVVMIPVIHYGIRPGSGKSWLITLLAFPILLVAPVLVVVATVVALVALGTQMIRADARGRRRSTTR